MWRRYRRYLLENWGSPFVVAFIALLITSAIFLSIGESSTANSVAVYAFYALVLGVILQIASYLKYGEDERRESVSSLPTTVSPPSRWRVGKMTLALVLVVIVIIATTSGVVYLKPYQSQSTTTTSAQPKSGPFSIGVGFIKEIPEPNDAFQILVGLNQTGGIQPFGFTAYWSDGVNQSNTIGVFTRSFQSNQTIPSAIRITASSSDGQNASTMVTIPAVSRTVVPTSTTESSTIARVVFVESGLPNGTLWSVSVSGESFDSNSSQVAFNYPVGGKFIFTIIGPHDKNFAWATVPTPKTGTTVVNGSNDINIVFSNETVSTSPSRLFVATSSPSAISAGPNTEELSITYVNTFPDQVQAIVLATARNNETGSIIIQTATIQPETNSSQAALFVFNSLPSGNYSASFFVESTTGVMLSATTDVTFTVGP